jgi:hypothetical protein
MIEELGVKLRSPKESNFKTHKSLKAARAEFSTLQMRVSEGDVEARVTAMKITARKECLRINESFRDGQIRMQALRANSELDGQILAVVE